MIYHSHNGDYNSYSLDDLDTEARATCLVLKKHLDHFDLIVVTGMSGILPAVPTALKLKVPLAILRKPEDSSHQYGGERFSRDGSRWLNGGAVKGARALWVDDFTASGETRARVSCAVRELGGEIVGEYLTRDGEFTHWKGGKPDWESQGWDYELLGYSGETP